MKEHNRKPELSRPQLFTDVINSEEYKHVVLNNHVILMRDAKEAINRHRRFLAQAEQYVFGTKEKGTKIDR
jgi:hypothetical protein